MPEILNRNLLNQPEKPRFSDFDLGVMRQIRRHEGFKESPDKRGTFGYYDSEGFPTRGIGRRFDDPRFPRDKSKANKLIPEIWDSWEVTDKNFIEDYFDHKHDATGAPGWFNASPKQQAGLTNLTFNMGNGWWSKWPKFSKAARDGHWGEAAKELKRGKTPGTTSVWYNQVGRRAEEVLNLIRPEEAL